jgi:hypothetical protein
MPTPDDVVAVLEPLIGLAEQPDNSNNAPPITTWYGMTDAWCAMTVSYAAARGGFSDDGGDTIDVPGVPTTTSKGWAYVPYLAHDFAQAGRYEQTPQRGDFGVLAGEVHVFLVEGVEDDDVLTIEGNYGNHLVRSRRRIDACEGFCRLPYDGTASPPAPPTVTPPPFPGYVREGSTGPAVTQVQQRLADRGWRIDVDGDFGRETDHVVRQFQGEKGLEVDGVVGPITWTNLWTAPITP